MRTEIQGTIEQLTPSVLTDGNEETIRMTKLGQIFTADWKQRLLLAGRIWTAHIGAITAGNAITKIVGGGNGTTMDMEQPEMVAGVDAGYFFIPISCDCQVESDCDSPDDFMEILLLADRTAAPPASVTGTTTTPVNKLDGGPSFPGRCFTALTDDMADPVLDELLCYRRWEATALVQAGSAANESDFAETTLYMHYEPEIPSILAGPCSMTLMFDGAVATNGIAQMTFAAVPSSWFPVA